MSSMIVRSCLPLTMSQLGENAPTAKPWAAHAAERPTVFGHGHVDHGYDAVAIRPRGTTIV